jgi:hypothetical protein
MPAPENSPCRTSPNTQRCCLFVKGDKSSINQNLSEFCDLG